MTSKYVQLGDVAEFINGAAFKPEDWGDEGLRIIRIQNLNDPSKPYNRTTRQVAERLYAQPGDLLVSWSASLGVFEWAGPDVGLVNQHIFRVLPDENKIDKRYLRFALDVALLDMQKHLHGATMVHVNRGEFLATKVYLPALSEQRRIAAILDKADALRAKRREALAQLDRLAQSIFVEMFGDALRSPVRQPLSVFVEEFRYGTSNKSGEDGYPALRIPNVVGGLLDLTELKTVAVADNEFSRLRLRDGDLLFVRTNGNQDYVGRGAVFSRSAVAPSGFDADSFIYASYLIRARLKPLSILPAVLQFFLSTEEGRRELRSYSKTSAGQFNINTEGLGALLIPNFPMDLQECFVQRLTAIEHQRLAQKSFGEELDTLFTSLQHRAFRGEL